MKKGLTFIILLSSLVSWAAKYYISPTGSDAAAGNFAAPFYSLNKAWTVVSAGDTVYLRGGTYSYTTQQVMTGKNGTAGNMIKIWAYPGETPVVSKGSGYTYNNDYGYGVYFSGNYVHFKGIDISGYTQETPEVWHGFRAYGNNNIFELLNVHNNGSGMFMGATSTGNLVLNCDFHHHADSLSPTPYNNGDGLQIAFMEAGTSNTIRGCRSWWNVDDGFDFYNNEGNVVIDSCWAFYNGFLPDTFTPAREENGDGNGFKLGDQQAPHSSDTLRTVRRCISFMNRSFGVSDNGATCRILIYNHTDYRSGIGIVLGEYANVVKNCIAWGNANYGGCIKTLSDESNNTFLGQCNINSNYSITAADFVSLDSTQLTNARQASGALPAITFLTLAEGSDAVNGGINVGLAFAGAAPDLGAFEYNYTSGGTTPLTPPTTTPPGIVTHKGKVLKSNQKLVVQ